MINEFIYLGCRDRFDPKEEHTSITISIGLNQRESHDINHLLDLYDSLWAPSANGSHQHQQKQNKTK